MTTIDQERGKGYVQGVKAMRDLLVAEFTAQGNGTFTGTEIAALIKQAPGPRREPNVELERSIPTADGEVPAGAVTS